MTHSVHSLPNCRLQMVRCTVVSTHRNHETPSPAQTGRGAAGKWHGLKRPGKARGRQQAECPALSQVPGLQITGHIAAEPCRVPISLATSPTP
jgi:hypothetical protein